MYDKDYGHDCHYHEWGPHGPDGPMIPHDHAYEWPDIYHPVPYGKEYKGNENLTLDCGEHWCPPRDHGRHGCGCEPHGHCYSDPCGAPMTMLRVLDDYMETAERLLEATTYQERCNCVDELRRVKVKMEKALGEFERDVEENAKAIDRLQHKVVYYIGRYQEMAKSFDDNATRQEELEKAVEEVGLLDYTDYYNKSEIDANYYNKTEIDGNYYNKTEIDAMVPKLSINNKTLVVRF